MPLPTPNSSCNSWGQHEVAHQVADTKGKQTPFPLKTLSHRECYLLRQLWGNVLEVIIKIDQTNTKTNTWRKTCPASMIPNPSLRLHAKLEEIFRRIFHRRNSAHKQYQNMKTQKYVQKNSPKRFVHEGYWEVLDEGVGGSLTTHLQEVFNQLQGVNKV